MDQIAEAHFNIYESISNVAKCYVMEPQERDIIGMGFPFLDTFGKLKLDFQGPILVPVELLKADLELLLGDIPTERKLRIFKAVQEAQD